jgi:hypothetical protein
MDIKEVFYLMRYLSYILALIAGSALSLEGTIYGELGKTIGQLETSFYNFSMGSVIMGLLWLFFGKGKISYAVEAAKWSLLGGVLGVVYFRFIQPLDIKTFIFWSLKPEAITALLSIFTPPFIIAQPPIHTLFPKVIGFAYSLPKLRSIGLSGCVAV